MLATEEEEMGEPFDVSDTVRNRVGGDGGGLRVAVVGTPDCSCVGGDVDTWFVGGGVVIRETSRGSNPNPEDGVASV